MRIIQGVHIVPFTNRLEPIETHHKNKKAKIEIDTIGYISRLTKDSSKNNQAPFHKYSKKKGKQDACSLKNIIHKYLLNNPKDKQKQSFHDFKDLSGSLEELIQELVELIEAFSLFLNPIKRFFLQRQDEQLSQKLGSTFNYLLICPELVEILEVNLLQEHQLNQDYLETIHKHLIERTNGYILKVQSFISSTGDKNASEILNDLFKIKNVYEKEYEIYQKVLLFVTSLVKNYKDGKALGLLSQHIEEQLSNLEIKKANSTELQAREISIKKAEAQLSFLEKITLQPTKNEDNTSTKIASAQYLHRFSELENAHVKEELSHRLNQYKQRLNELKKKY